MSFDREREEGSSRNGYSQRTPYEGRYSRIARQHLQRLTVANDCSSLSFINASVFNDPDNGTDTNNYLRELNLFQQQRSVSSQKLCQNRFSPDLSSASSSSIRNSNNRWSSIQKRSAYSNIEQSWVGEEVEQNNLQEKGGRTQNHEEPLLLETRRRRRRRLRTTSSNENHSAYGVPQQSLDTNTAPQISSHMSELPSFSNPLSTTADHCRSQRQGLLIAQNYSGYRNSLNKPKNLYPSVSAEQKYDFPICRSEAVVETLIFQWDVCGFSSLRKMAQLKCLPYRDRLLSPKFSSSRGGVWHLALFPYAEREAQKHISLYLFCDSSYPQVAEFRIGLLNGQRKKIAGTELYEQPTLFTQECPSWGWHQFLPGETEEMFTPFLVKDDVLSIEATVDVFVGIEELIAPRFIYNAYLLFYNNNGDEGNDEKTRKSGCGMVNALVKENQCHVRKIPIDNSCSTTLGSILETYCIDPIDVWKMPKKLSIRLNKRHKLIPHINSYLNSDYLLSKKKDDISNSSQLWTSTPSRSTYARQLRETAITLNFPKKNVSSYLNASKERKRKSSSYENSDSHDYFDNTTHVPPILKNAPPTNLLQDLINLFKSHPELKDLDVNCSNGKKLKTCRILLAARSPVFRAALFGDLKRSTEISLIHVSSDTAQEFLNYIETGEASVLNIECWSTVTDTYVCLELLELADIYLISDLYVKCTKLLIRSITEYTALDIYLVAQRLGCSILMRAARHLLRSTTVHHLSKLVNSNLLVNDKEPVSFQWMTG